MSLWGGGATKFGAYAYNWINTRELAPKTRESYLWLMDRIDAAIGNIRLDKLRADHLEEFHKNLREISVKQRGDYAESHTLEKVVKKNNISIIALAKKAGISTRTCSTAACGQHISIQKATDICKALRAYPEITNPG